MLLGEGQGKATKYLKAHDVRLAKLSSSAFQNVEKKLEKMSPEATKFIAQVCHAKKRDLSNLTLAHGILGN